MFDDAIRTFLEKPLIARLSTIDPHGYPHTVPIWFMLDGDDLLFITDRDTRKAQNALANAKGAAAIGGDAKDGAGYLIRGDFTITTDEGKQVTDRMVDRYMEPSAAAATKEMWKDDDVVVIRLVPSAVVRVM
ncbi:MAG: pyridoxamine 5'-phosphate oxidase family protein [Chloroflexota bacterium]|nr:pyridoxamine 5'-phosphate oxidase family protein [Chloroflexota bacterium]